MGGQNVDNVCLIGCVIELFIYFRYQSHETFYWMKISLMFAKHDTPQFKKKSLYTGTEC